MADLSHETRDDGFHEIQLSGKQLVFLFMATTVVSVAIFLCGVLVGRGVRVEAVTGEPVASVATTPVPESLPEASPPIAVAEPPVPASETEALSYPDRLQRDKLPAEDLKPPPSASAPPPALRRAPSEPDAARTATNTPARSTPAAAASASPAARPGKWAVQVISLRDRNSAAQIVRRLSDKGYPAFLVTPAPDAPTQLYKVQVGRYNDRREAEQISRRLRKEEQFGPIIVP